MKKKLATSLCSLLLFAPALPGYVKAATPVTVSINGTTTILDGEIKEGVTYVPVRQVSELIKANIRWSQKNQTVTIQKENKNIQVKPNNTEAIVNDHSIYLDEEPILLKNKIYLPLRAICENLGYTINWNANQRIIELEDINENQLEIETKKYVHETDFQAVDVQYPVLKGMDDPVIQAKINNVLVNHVRHLLDLSDGNLTEEDYELIEVNPDVSFSYSTNYQVTYNQQGLLNILFTDYMYEGGAHGDYDYTSYLFDLSSGEQLTLADLFGEVDNVTIINNEILNQANKKGYTYFDKIPSINATHNRFYLTNNQSIVVYFSLYDYTPYADGIPEYEIPLNRFNNN